MDTPTWTLIYLILMPKMSGGDWLSCIPDCTCKWSSGKKTASCVSAGLESIPTLASEIQTLDLHGNPLKTLEQEAFARIELVNLQRLNLSLTSLQYLHPDAFKELRILIELDLSQNDLTKLSPYTFKENDRLRLLVLNDNPLGTLVSEQFPLLKHLKKLELARCKLRKVHPTSFINLRSVETIHLQQNLISYLHEDTFNLPVLKTLTLADNPWNCDCRLRRFHEWFLENNIGREEVLCSVPAQLAQISWWTLRGPEMVCPTTAVTFPNVIRTESGAEIVFGCFVQGDPKPLVTWHHQQNEIYNKTDYGEIFINRIQVEHFDEYNDDVLNKTSQWINITITNVTSDHSGEWKCSAKSRVNEAKSSVIIFLPKARIATARMPPDYTTLFMVAASVLAMTIVGFVATCVCWKTRRRRVPPSRSFTDQEKKLLDSSIAVSYDRTSGDLGSSSYGFEMLDRSMSLGSEDTQRMDPVQITIEGTPGVYPPPPAEFSLPAPYGNIFISVQVASHSEKYPDLLGGGTTLPRRSRTCFLRAPYDNMGPRITAAGSSTWSLPGPHADGKVEKDVPLTIPLSTFSTEFTAL